MVIYYINSDDIVDMDKVFLYNCPRKMEFLETGYGKYS